MDGPKRHKKISIGISHQLDKIHTVFLPIAYNFPLLAVNATRLLFTFIGAMRDHSSGDHIIR